MAVAAASAAAAASAVEELDTAMEEEEEEGEEEVEEEEGEEEEEEVDDETDDAAIDPVDAAAVVGDVILQTRGGRRTHKIDYSRFHKGGGVGGGRTVGGGRGISRAGATPVSSDTHVAPPPKRQRTTC